MTDNLVVRRPPLVIFDPETGLHDLGEHHPETPQRAEAALRGIRASSDVWEEAEAKPAPLSAIEAVHDGAYLAALKEFCDRGGGQVVADTHASAGTFEVARRAAGGVLQGVEGAAGGSPAICLSRPPGHHASAESAMGFCFLNHAAIATRWAQSSGVAERVAIFDFDVHHGNGTSDIFWNDPSVLYVSIHQWPWYPGTGALEETGASGSIVNIPMPAYSADEEHLAVTRSIALGVIRSFAPGMIVISAGFDAHADDPLSLQSMSSEGFGQIAGMITGLSLEVCGIPPVATLEGGYHLGALEESIGRMAQGMVPGPHLAREATTSDMPLAPSLERVIRFHLPGGWAEGQ